MQNSRINKLRTVLSVLLLIFTIFSISFTVTEANHKITCTDDNCPICLVIQVVKTNFGGLILTFAAFGILQFIEKSQKLTFSSIINANIINTLFSLKTRLND